LLFERIKRNDREDKVEEEKIGVLKWKEKHQQNAIGGNVSLKVYD